MVFGFIVGAEYYCNNTGVCITIIFTLENAAVHPSPEMLDSHDARC